MEDLPHLKKCTSEKGITWSSFSELESLMLACPVFCYVRCGCEVNTGFLYCFVKVWTSVPHEGRQVYFLGPTATEHPEQDVLPDDQWDSSTGTGYLSVTMHLLILGGEFSPSVSLSFSLFFYARAVWQSPSLYQSRDAPLLKCGVVDKRLQL